MSRVKTTYLPVRSKDPGGTTITVGSSHRRFPVLGYTTGAGWNERAEDQVPEERYTLAFPYQCDQSVCERQEYTSTGNLCSQLILVGN